MEVNLSQMLAYAIYRGPVAAVSGKVDRFGLVQGVCGSPRFDKPGVAAEGQSFYLLLDAVAQRWAYSYQTRRFDT